MAGIAGRTKAGELSLYATTVSLLAPCLHAIPQALEDPELRVRHRCSNPPSLVHLSSATLYPVPLSSVTLSLTKASVSSVPLFGALTTPLWSINLTRVL